MDAQTNIGSLWRRVLTTEHSQEEEIQACWELRMWIKTKKKKRKVEQLLSRFLICSQYKQARVKSWSDMQEQKKKKLYRAIWLLLFSPSSHILRKWWDLLHTYAQTHSWCWWACSHNYSRGFIIIPAAVNYSWVRNLLSMCRLANALCRIFTLTTKSWHCWNWDGGQLLFITAQQSLFHWWLYWIT